MPCYENIFIKSAIFDMFNYKIHIPEDGKFSLVIYLIIFSPVFLFFLPGTSIFKMVQENPGSDLLM